MMISNRELYDEHVVEVARVLAAAWTAGIIDTAADVPSYQRFEIARKLGMSAIILQGIGPGDRRARAMEIIVDIRYGFEQGVLTVTRHDAIACVQATLHDVQPAIDATPESVPAICFDASPVALYCDEAA